MRISGILSIFRTMLFCLCVLILDACMQSGTSTAVQPTLSTSLPATPGRMPTHTPGLPQDQILTLESLEVVDDYPLYVMHYYADHETIGQPSGGRWYAPITGAAQGERLQYPDRWSCSLFAAFGDAETALYGRNFDWQYSPVMLLYTHPKSGNTSVSLVDLTYLFGDQADHLMELSLEQRLPLLETHQWPFDGMNDCGLVIGMAAVPSSGEFQTDPKKTDIGSLGIMREILDHACTVDEAIELMDAHNILWEGGPELHYLIAESTGKAVLVEFFQGKIRIIPNQNPWHLATNFLLSGTGDNLQGVCHRYDTIAGVMLDSLGKLSSERAMNLLSQVSQDITQWSVVYSAITGEVQIVVGRDYQHPLSFELDMNP